MNMSDICFILENKNLYVDEYLVDFNIPIFFICKDDDNYKYAVECIDTKALTYVISKVDLTDVLDMLQNKVTLRDFILNGNNFWLIKSGDSIENDIVEVIKEIDSNKLPKENEFLDLHNKKIENYIKKLEMEKVSFNSSFEIIDVSLKTIYSSTFRAIKAENTRLYRKQKRIIRNVFPIYLAGGVF